jgi:hypothetical protein
MMANDKPGTYIWQVASEPRQEDYQVKEDRLKRIDATI